MGRAEGQCEPECRTSPLCACDAHAALVAAHYATTNIESKTKAITRAIGRFGHGRAIVGIPDTPKLRSGQSDSVVSHQYASDSRLSSHLDLDWLVLRRELYRICQIVGHHLHDAIPVCQHWHGL